VAEDWTRPVVHWELRARDPEKQRAFYSKMFNWDITDGKVMRIPAGVEPPPSISGQIRQSDTPGVTIFIQVLDLQQSLDRAVALGGTVTHQIRHAPGQASLAGIADPEGNPISLVQQ
jgi:predicted enzyme related to lactoylglutathione lyase